MKRFLIKMIETFQDGLEVLKEAIEGERDVPEDVVYFTVAGVPIQAVKEGRTWRGRVLTPEGVLIIERGGARTHREAGELVMKAFQEMDN